MNSLLTNLADELLILTVFLRATNRKKDGKDHRYYSVVENERVSSGKSVRRTVLYPGRDQRWRA